MYDHCTTRDADERRMLPIQNEDYPGFDSRTNRRTINGDTAINTNTIISWGVKTADVPWIISSCKVGNCEPAKTNKMHPGSNPSSNPIGK